MVMLTVRFGLRSRSAPVMVKIFAVVCLVICCLLETTNSQSTPEVCDGLNEEYVLGAPKDRTCDGGEYKLCQSTDGCHCKPNFVRFEIICIKQSQCPGAANDTRSADGRQCNDDNAEYVTARTTERTCKQRNVRPIRPVRECRCKRGFIRYKHICIREKDCPIDCGPNEVYDYTEFSDPTCDREGYRIRCPKFMCHCRKNFVRLNGICVPPWHCRLVATKRSANSKPIVPTCNSNETYVFLNTSEPTCDEPVPKPSTPEWKCRCEPGLVRHNGVCIPLKDCPVKCNDPNEDETIALFSEPTCDDLLPRTITPIKECRCRNGYVRHESKCIKPEECSKKCDSTDEEYVEVSMSEPTCDQRVPISIPTIKECRCKSGLVRYQGKCISPENCPVTCPDPNESYVLTYFTEPTCDDPIPRSAPPAKECRCIQGYIRHEKQCIKAEECPVKCKSLNEKYIAANTTEITCDDRIPKPIPEVKECRCINGYARYNGECIPIGECPVECKENEAFINALFTEPTCDDQIPKTLPVPVSECRCRKGYARHDGKCISRKDCPSKCKNPNEEYVHAIFSEPTCYNQIPRSITPLMECRCKQGYLRHKGNCIPRDSCCYY